MPRRIRLASELPTMHPPPQPSLADAVVANVSDTGLTYRHLDGATHYTVNGVFLSDRDAIVEVRSEDSDEGEALLQEIIDYLDHGSASFADLGIQLELARQEIREAQRQHMHELGTAKFKLKLWYAGSAIIVGLFLPHLLRLLKL